MLPRPLMIVALSLWFWLASANIARICRADPRGGLNINMQLPTSDPWKEFQQAYLRYIEENLRAAATGKSTRSDCRSDKDDAACQQRQKLADSLFILVHPEKSGLPRGKQTPGLPADKMDKAIKMLDFLKSSGTRFTLEENPTPPAQESPASVKPAYLQKPSLSFRPEEMPLTDEKIRDKSVEIERQVEENPEIARQTYDKAHQELNQRAREARFPEGQSQNLLSDSKASKAQSLAKGMAQAIKDEREDGSIAGAGRRPGAGAGMLFRPRGNGPKSPSHPANPVTPQDLVLASAMGFGESFRSEPEALMRRPDFFSVIPREDFGSLKGDYRGRPELREAAFKHVAMTQGGRDFIWSASCQRVSGDCNSLTHLSAYNNGKDVPPEDLKAIHKDIHSKPASPKETSPDFRHYRKQFEERSAHQKFSRMLSRGGSVASRALSRLEGFLSAGLSALGWEASHKDRIPASAQYSPKSKLPIASGRGGPPTSGSEAGVAGSLRTSPASQGVPPAPGSSGWWAGLSWLWLGAALVILGTLLRLFWRYHSGGSRQQT